MEGDLEEDLGRLGWGLDGGLRGGIQRVLQIGRAQGNREKKGD